MDESSIVIERFIKEEEEKSYFLLPFEVPQDVEKVEISYEYPRFSYETLENRSLKRKEVNIIDFGLNGAGGKYIGASGSDRSSIYISAGKSSQGFAPVDIKAGEWSIIVGAYKVEKGGVNVTYHITFTMREECSPNETCSIGDGVANSQQVKSIQQSSATKTECISLQESSATKTEENHLQKNSATKSEGKSNKSVRKLTPYRFKGDTHMHTLGSDGVYSIEEVAKLAKQMGLEYIFVTDHNNYAHNFEPVDVKGITVIPGTEWTHYKGHVGLLGVKKPFESAFCVNSLEEAKEKLNEAKNNGALIVLNHPFCPNCGQQWGMDSFDYDAIEVWNGCLSIEANLKCLDWWQEQLILGRKIPITGGSDFHRFDVGRMMGMPTTCVYAETNAQEDIINAIKNGNSYISMFSKGPDLYIVADDKILGETASRGSEVIARFWNIKANDIICLITDTEVEQVPCEEGMMELEVRRIYPDAKFVRMEILRKLDPDMPPMKALITNPIYFD